FDLAKGPLFRATLFQVSPGEHVLLLVMHHAVSDLWSLKILLQEIAVLCQAYGAGLPSPLVELPIQFPDFAAWQTEWLAGNALQRQREYWKTHLSGAPAEPP